jgi:hypothetical protein
MELTCHGQLARGLAFSRKLAAAVTYEDWYKLLDGYPGVQHDFFQDGIGAMLDFDPENWEQTLAEYTVDMIQNLIKQSSTGDPDPGQI